MNEPSTQPLSPIIQSLLQEWNTIKTNTNSFFKREWKPAVQFLLKCLDVFVVTIEPMIVDGTAKKIAVTNALTVVYTAVIGASLPIFLKPFSAQIQAFIFTAIVPVLIDFVVGQYNKMGGIPVPSTK